MRGLTDEGRAQSRALARYLRECWQPIDCILSSNLPRAAETAAIVAPVLGLSVQYAQEWREMNNGDLAGMRNDIAEQRYPGLYARTLGMDEPHPDGESPRRFFARVAAAFDAVCEDLLEQRLPPNALVVTHAGVINIVYHRLHRLQWSNAAPSFPAVPTGIHEICHRDGVWELTRENDATHLGGM